MKQPCIYLLIFRIQLKYNMELLFFFFKDSVGKTSKRVGFLCLGVWLGILCFNVCIQKTYTFQSIKQWFAEEIIDSRVSRLYV